MFLYACRFDQILCMLQDSSRIGITSHHRTTTGLVFESWTLLSPSWLFDAWRLQTSLSLSIFSWLADTWHFSWTRNDFQSTWSSHSCCRSSHGWTDFHTPWQLFFDWELRLLIFHWCQMDLLQTQDRLHQSQLMSQRVHDMDIQQSALPDWMVSELQNRVDNYRRSNCRSRPPLTDDHRRTCRVKGPARRPGRIEGSSHPPASERSGPTIPSHGLSLL